MASLAASKSLAFSKYGISPNAPAPVTEPATGLYNGAVTTTAGRFSPDRPFVWLLGIGAATIGLIAANATVRVGPVKASAAVGK